MKKRKLSGLKRLFSFLHLKIRSQSNREINRTKIESFDKMVRPLIEWLERDENKEALIFEGSKQITYPEMAQLIRNGDSEGINYANEYLKEERQMISKIGKGLSFS